MRALILILITFIYLQAGVDFKTAMKDYNHGQIAKAVLGFDALCLQNDAKPCFMLGIIYEKQKPAKAMKYYNKACKFGLSSGCINLALMLEKEKSYESELFFAKACRLKDSRACLHLGQKYLKDGDGVLAVRFLKAACSFGNAKACFELAHMLELGEIIAQDKASSLSFYKKACELKDAKACFIVAAAFFKAGDQDKALRKLKRACDLRYHRACASYRELKAKIDSF